MQQRSPVCGALAVLASLFLSPSAPAQQVAPMVTIVEGASTIISGADGFLPAAGVRLRQCDILSTGPQALVQVELGDGGAIVLGPDSRLVFELPYAGAPVVGPHFLASGWAKITVPKREKAPPHRIDTPHFNLLVDAGVAVLRAAADGGEFFVEQGDAVALESAGRSLARVGVGAGRAYARKSGQDRGTVTDRVNPSFVQGMPRSFRDTLPSLLAQLKARNVRARPAPDRVNAEAWLKTVPELRPCVVDITVLGAQRALERDGFDVGPLDGILGPRTQAALREFQQRRGLTRSGRLDPETLRALDVADRP